MTTSTLIANRQARRRAITFAILIAVTLLLMAFSGNPIVRYTGSMIFLAAVAVPLLLTSVWRAGEDP